MRKMKWQAKMDEKKRKEEEELQKSIANTCSPRHFNHEEFQNWPGTYEPQVAPKQVRSYILYCLSSLSGASGSVRYADRMNQQQSFEATRQEKKRSEARLQH